MCERTVVPVFAPLFVLLATSPALAHGGEDLIEATAWTTWELTPDIVIPTLLVAACYIAGLLRRANAAQPVPAWRHVVFFAGLGAVFIAQIGRAAVRERGGQSV